MSIKHTIQEKGEYAAIYNCNHVFFVVGSVSAMLDIYTFIFRPPTGATGRMAILSVIVIVCFVLAGLSVSGASRPPSGPIVQATKPPQPTPTTPPVQLIPTTQPLQASNIITQARTFRNIDQQGNPFNFSTTFSPGETFYVTFSLNLQQGQNGYVGSARYIEKQLVDRIRPFAVSSLQHGGYIPYSFSYPTIITIGLYWCTQPDCSDAMLAAVLSVTICNGC